MEIKIINEAGLEEALLGMKFSFQQECAIEDIKLTVVKKPYFYRDVPLINRYLETAKKLCKRDGGHNTFLRCINVWAIMRMPLKFWKQMDQYKVGTSTLSKSTMHTLMKRKLTEDDFTDYVYPSSIDTVNRCIEAKDFNGATDNLPDGFLQTRMWHGNYATIRNIILQRQGHKLDEWDTFIEAMLNGLNTPELLGLDERYGV